MVKQNHIKTGFSMKPKRIRPIKLASEKESDNTHYGPDDRFTLFHFGSFGGYTFLIVVFLCLRLLDPEHVFPDRLFPLTLSIGLMFGMIIIYSSKTRVVNTTESPLRNRINYWMTLLTLILYFMSYFTVLALLYLQMDPNFVW